VSGIDLLLVQIQTGVRPPLVGICLNSDSMYTLALISVRKKQLAAVVWDLFVMHKHKCIDLSLGLLLQI